MENPTPHEQDDSRLVSENNGSDQGLTKQASNNSVTHVNGQMYDSTPTTVRNEQPSTTPAMPPPPRPNFKATPTSAQPSSHSTQDSSQTLPAPSVEKKHGNGRQRTTSSKDASQEATQRVTRKRSYEEIDRRQAAEESDEEDEDDHDQDATHEFNEPANAISPFDWEELQQRYHDQVGEYRQQEEYLYRQFRELSEVSSTRNFNHSSTDNGSTSSSGPGPEPIMRTRVAASGMYIGAASALLQSQLDTDIVHSMRTQVTLVQHHEQELEAKRLHCKRNQFDLARLHVHANTPQTSKSLKPSRVRFDFFLVTEITVGNLFSSGRSNH